MRALVTGGAGFIGSALVSALLSEGWAVHVLDDLSRGRAERVPAAAELHIADVADTGATARVLDAARPTVVFHLAAQIDVRRSLADPARDARVNVLGTAVVLEAARRAGARRVLLASTAAVYGEPAWLPIGEDAPRAPISPYGEGKAAAEGYVALYGHRRRLSTASLRMANVYGPGQDPRGESGVIAIFAAAAAAGRPVTVFGDGRQTRDYVHVADALHAFLLAAGASVGGALNIATGRETSLLEVAAALGLETRRAPPRAGEIFRSCLDPARAERALGWRAVTPLADGLNGMREAFSAAAGAAAPGTRPEPGT